VGVGCRKIGHLGYILFLIFGLYEVVGWEYPTICNNWWDTPTLHLSVTLQLGTSQEQFYQDDEGILFLVGLSHEEHSDSMRRLGESN